MGGGFAGRAGIEDDCCEGRERVVGGVGGGMRRYHGIWEEIECSSGSGGDMVVVLSGQRGAERWKDRWWLSRFEKEERVGRCAGRRWVKPGKVANVSRRAQRHSWHLVRAGRFPLIAADIGRNRRSDVVRSFLRYSKSSGAEACCELDPHSSSGFISKALLRLIKLYS